MAESSGNRNAEQAADEERRFTALLLKLRGTEPTRITIPSDFEEWLNRNTDIMHVGPDPRSGWVLCFDTGPRKPSREWLREARKVRGGR